MLKLNSLVLYIKCQWHCFLVNKLNLYILYYHDRVRHKNRWKNGFLINPRILRILSFQSSQLEGPFISITMFFEIIPFPRPVFVDFKQFWKWPNFFRLNFSFQIPLFHKCNKETLTKLFKQKNSSSSQTGINIEDIFFTF